MTRVEVLHINPVETPECWCWSLAFQAETIFADNVVILSDNNLHI